MEVPLERFECGELLKVLLSTDCRFDCRYCPNAWRRGKKIGARKVADYVRKKGIKKVFISSSIFSSVDEVMEEIELAGLMVRDVVDYLHLKIMPYASEDHIKRVAEIADRISLNFESPRSDILSELSSFKDLASFTRMQRKIARIAKSCNTSFTTQIIVGLGETDLDILKFAEKMYAMGAARVYYSPFVPVEGTPMERHVGESRSRIARLYRADALIRLYGVPVRKLKRIMVGEYLPKRDPKILMAREFGIQQPEDIPGVGKRRSSIFQSGQRKLPEYL